MSHVVAVNCPLRCGWEKFCTDDSQRWLKSGSGLAHTASARVQPPALPVLDSPRACDSNLFESVSFDLYSCVAWWIKLMINTSGFVGLCGGDGAGEEDGGARLSAVPAW